MLLTSHPAPRRITADPHHPRNRLSVPHLQQPVTKDQSLHQHSSPHPLGSRHRVHLAVDDEPGVVGLHVAEDVEAADMEVVGVRWKGRRFLSPFHRYPRYIQ